MKDKEVVRVAVRVSIVSIVANVLLSAVKLIAGIIGKSMALVSDAIHSLSDVFGSVIVIIGVKFSKKEADEDHPYGHEKIECLASLALAAILFFTAGIIVFDTIEKILNNESLETPSLVALIVAFVSIVAKEGLYWYTILAAKKIGSQALKAEAWHHRSDALSSIGSLIGVGGAMLGYKIFDPIAAGIIALLICKVAVSITKDAVDKMIDKSCDPETIKAMSEVVESVPGVIKLDLIKTRLFGTRCYVDIEISADKNLRLEDSHQIAENVHDLIEEKFEEVKHCTVHVNPSE
ncbi:MAG: cation transporter [Eubacterium sp.]|nr:cation transporter [Eubacterium sp.]